VANKNAGQQLSGWGDIVAIGNRGTCDGYFLHILVMV
jgi:hypothetical protein